MQTNARKVVGLSSHLTQELEAYLFCDKVQEIIMDCYGANRLMNRPFVENRPVVAITPKGKVKDGFLIGHDGVNATIKRADGRRDFSCSLDNVKFR